MRSLPRSRALSCAPTRQRWSPSIPTSRSSPASALKLTTAAAFLAEVGGTGQFTTVVRGAKPDDARNGEGRPALSAAATRCWRRGLRHDAQTPAHTGDRHREARRQIVAAGVVRVTGGIVVSDDVYDTERRVPTWSPGYTSAGDVGPIGALAVDDGFSAYAPRRSPRPTRQSPPGSRSRRAGRCRGDDHGADAAGGAVGGDRSLASIGQRRLPKSSPRCCARATTTPPSCC